MTIQLDKEPNPKMTSYIEPSHCEIPVRARKTGDETNMNTYNEEIIQSIVKQI